MRVGVISDTHGLLRPAAKAFLTRCDHIVHAGDVCDPSILEELATLGPVTAVRGNNDKGRWAQRLKAIERLRFDPFEILVIHDLADLDVDPAAKGIHAVLSGHSHKPRIERKDGVLYVNPGSAGPRRFKLPIAAAELRIGPRGLDARIELLS
jgi:putative phosphoesterase